MNFPERRRRFTGRFGELSIDAAVISSPANIRYLSGFTGSNALLAVTPSKSVLLTDPRYSIQARQETDCQVRTVIGRLSDAVALRGRIGFENTRISYDLYSRLKGRLEPLGTVLDEMRMVKSPEEVERIRASVRLNSEAYWRGLRRVRPETTESGLAAEFDYQMRRLGAEKPAFDTIVAAGPRTALPHAQPTGARMPRRGLLLVDMGACLDGYASDMTRMAHFGRPDTKVRNVYRAVLEAQLAALGAVRAGVTAGAVDSVARRELRKAGFARQFVHSTGHGLGLEIHEAPRLGKREKQTRLEEGMVVTIEPGVYIEGWGGIRIEDTVVVTAQGCEVLTPTPKELTVL